MRSRVRLTDEVPPVQQLQHGSRTGLAQHPLIDAKLCRFSQATQPHLVQLAARAGKMHHEQPVGVALRHMRQLRRRLHLL